MSKRSLPAGGRGDELLLRAVASGRPVSQAAVEAGVSPRTAYRRVASPGFQQRLACIRDELITAAAGELAASASQAVVTVRELLDSRDERVRLQAARILLDQLLRLREAVALEQRVQTLERHHDQQQRRR